jgi:hypothetical protein
MPITRPARQFCSSGLARITVIAVVAAMLGLVTGPVRADATPPGVQGRVTHDTSAVVGATVDVVLGASIVATSSTDANGRYEIDLPTPGTYDVRVTPTASANLTGTTVTGVAVGAVVPAVVDVQLTSPLGSLDVTVRNGLGIAVPGTRVTARSSGNFDVVAAVAGPDGRARLVTRPGSYRLRVEHPTGSPGSLLPAALTVFTNDAVADVAVGGGTLDLTVPTATLTTTVTRESDSTVVAGAAVGASGRDLAVDLGGGVTGVARFTAAPATTGVLGVASQLVVAGTGIEVTASPSLADRLLTRAAALVDVPAAGTAAGIELPNAPLVPVTVEVRDAIGGLVQGARVSTFVDVADTGADGRATVLTRTDQASTLAVLITSNSPHLPERVRFTRSILPNAPIDYTVQALVAEVVVEVTDDPANTPVPGVAVRVDGPGVATGTGWGAVSTAGPRDTDASGRASFRVYPGGEHGFTATPIGRPRTFVEAVVPTGGTLVPIPLETVDPGTNPAQTASVTGRVVTDGGTPMGWIEVRSPATGQLLTTTAADGTFSLTVKVAAEPQGLRFQGTDLLSLFKNGPRAPLPGELFLVIRDLVLATVPNATVALGDIVVPFDTLDVRVVDDTGAGLRQLALSTEARTSFFPIMVSGVEREARGTASYPPTRNSVAYTNLTGQAVLRLFPGYHRVSVLSFPSGGAPPTLLAEGFGVVAPGTADTLQIVIPSAVPGPPVTRLEIVPAEPDDPSTSRAPGARIVPIVTIPDDVLEGFQGSFTNAYLRGWGTCWVEENGEETGEKYPCPKEGGDEFTGGWDLMSNDAGNGFFPVFPSYPATVTVTYSSSVLYNLPNSQFPNIVYRRSEGTRSQTFTILGPLDVPPTVQVANRSVEGDEGSVVVFTASGTDVEGPVEISWDTDGDGIGDVTGPTLLLDLPDGPDWGDIEVLATDSAGQIARRTVTWGSRNVAPTGRIITSGPDAAGIVTVEVVDVTDASAADVAAGIIVELDLDDDGVFEIVGATVGTTGTIDTTTGDFQGHPVHARLTDKDEGERVLTARLDLSGRVLEAGGPYRVDEGGSVVLEASDSDLDAVITWDIPGQGTNLPNPATFDASGLDGPTKVTATARSCASVEGQAVCLDSPVTVDVDNVAPTVAASAVSGTEGVPVELPVSVTDPGFDEQLTLTITWGDGSTETFTGSAASLNARTFSHTYAVADVYDVGVAVADDDGGAGSDATTATIAEPDPVIDTVDLRLEVEGGGDPVAPGDPLGYLVTVHNDDEDPATGVSLTIEVDPALLPGGPAPLSRAAASLLPFGTSVPWITSVTGSWTCNVSGAVVVCDLAGPLAPGASVAVRLALLVGAGATGSIATTLTLVSDIELADPARGVVRRVTMIATAPPGPDPSDPPTEPTEPTTPPAPTVPTAPAPPTPAPTVPAPTVPAVTGPLPATGSPLTTPLVSALVLLLAGVALARVRRTPYA